MNYKCVCSDVQYSFTAQPDVTRRSSRWCRLISIHWSRKRVQDFSLIEQRPPLCFTLFPDFTLDFNFHHIWTLRGPFVRRENNEDRRQGEEFEPSRIYFSYRQTYINLLQFHCQRECSANRGKKGQSWIVSLLWWGMEKLLGALKCLSVLIRDSYLGRNKKERKKDMSNKKTDR